MAITQGQHEKCERFLFPARHRPGTRSWQRYFRSIQTMSLEYVTRSWYQYPDGDNAGKNPAQGMTDPKYSGPKPPYEFLKTDEKYSWLKAPRYNDKPMEVGPLARTLVAYASGDQQVKLLVDSTLSKLRLPATALFSTLGRVAARALEADIMVSRLSDWVAQLDDNMAHGNVRLHNGDKWNPSSWPKSCSGLWISRGATRLARSLG